MVQQGTAERTRSEVRLQSNAMVSTNTYFGRFPASYWQRWTAMTEVTVTARTIGTGHVALVASDVYGDPRTVAVTAATNGADLKLSAKIDRFVDGGGLWLEITSSAEPLAVSKVRWEVAAPVRARRAAVVICTYNRADDCAVTLSALAGDADALADIDTVYVVDQGSDRVDTRPAFHKAAAQLGEKLVYLNQPNLGGSGGFTRGLYEVSEGAQADHDNVIFMDDDVLCEPEVLVRLNAFANRTVEPAIVGAQTLHLLHPNRLHIAAEYVDFDELRCGIAVPEALVNSDVRLHNQERRVDTQYNGWWTCLIPAEVIDRVGYPLPLFFQWDDIEFAFRARAAGFASVNLPGAGLWHADFAWKDWDEWYRYFNVRNALVTAAVHSNFNTTEIARNHLRRIVHSIAGMQYGLALTLIAALEDFLNGPAILTDGGMAAAESIRRERAKFGETQTRSVSELPGLRGADIGIIGSAPEPSKPGLVLAKRAFDQIRGRTNKAPAAFRYADASWWQVSKFDTAVITDASQEGVRVRKRDVTAMRALSLRGTRACYRLVREGKDVAQQYRDAMPALTSRENWARLFEKP